MSARVPGARTRRSARAMGALTRGRLNAEGGRRSARLRQTRTGPGEPATDHSVSASLKKAGEPFIEQSPWVAVSSP